jgi:hypothetical protein
MGGGDAMTVKPLPIGGCPSMEAVAKAVKGRSGASARLGADWQRRENSQYSGAEKRDGFLQWLVQNSTPLPPRGQVQK